MALIIRLSLLLCANIDRISFDTTTILPFTCFWAVLFAVVPLGQAQNLVPDGGFEQYFDDPPYTVSLVNESPQWGRLDGTTDFFHRGYRACCSVPSNTRGYQVPAQGDGHAGIIAYPARRGEFLVAELLSPLEEGQLYEFRFKANLSGRSQYATDDIGAAFLKAAPVQGELGDYVYHIKNKEGRILSDTAAWATVSGHYLADGGERYLLLGNLHDSDRITTVKEIAGGQDFWAYYYIDEVLLQTCGGQGVQLEAIPGTDTVICQGTQAVLQGLPDADAYYWEGIGTLQDIVVEQAGSYVLNNFFDCSIKRQVFKVETDNCDCSISLPSLNRRAAPAQPEVSINVQSYGLRLYDAAGRLLWQASQASLPGRPLPNVSGTYFWQANLDCLSERDIPISRSMSGKLMVVD